ncbi:MAG: FHA domain-containing protein [Kiritimatiellae bacterium]|nr:FHA domain-containing protein [Kiritimatiellia bacterium]
MAHTVYLVELKSKGNTLQTLRMSVGCQEVKVGRSEQCVLRTPEYDHSVSGIHVRLFWKGDSLYLEDNSRNGVYFKGKRITKVQKISGGNLFGIGTCALQFKKLDSKKENLASKPHKLEYLNGDHAGKMVDIRLKDGETEFVIGRDPACDLYLPDSTTYTCVSRRHALLWLDKDGSECWIKGARGEVKVNGEVVPAKGRLLKNDDKIRIAYFDFRFLDRSKPHPRLFLWLKVFAVAATLSVMAVAYVMVSTQVKASEYLLSAERLAAELEFDEARKTLVTARLARDADKCRARIDALDAKIDRWEKTVSDWKEAQQSLRDGSFLRARKILETLTGAGVDAWSWNGTTAFKDKRKAEFACHLLRRYQDAEGVLSGTSSGQPEQQAESIREAVEPLAAFLEESQDEIAAQPENLVSLTNALVDVRRRMEEVRTGFGRVDDCIAKLDSLNPDFERLAKQLEEVMNDKGQHPTVRAYAEKYRQPCSGLAEARRFIADEFADITAMRFKEVKARAGRLRLPEKELCARHPRLSGHRTKLDGHHADVQDLAKNLQTIVESLHNQGVEKDSCGVSLERVLDAVSWKKALTFDCLDGKVPARTRKTPCGTYDALLGVEFTYQSLIVLPKAYTGDCLRRIEFAPDIVKVKSVFEAVEAFVDFITECVSRHNWKWLMHGELGVFYKYCLSLLDKRKVIAEALASYQGQPRQRLVAGFYAGYLIPSSLDSRHRSELAEEFKRIDREIGRLCEQYESAEPSEQIALRARILETGIPGDPKVQAKWAAKYDGGQE